MTINAKNLKMAIETVKAIVFALIVICFVKKRRAKSTEIASFLGITEQKLNRRLWRNKIVELKGL